MVDAHRLQAAYQQARDDLLACRNSEGHWVGQLSSSALSTATAVSALSISLSAANHATPQLSDGDDAQLIQRGLIGLAKAQNADGGWGDTDLSHSNIATSMLAVAAFHLARQSDRFRQSVSRGQDYIERCGAVDALRQRYGSDKTFVVPILTNSALAGLASWQEIPALPFELAAIPQRFYRWARMPVVSYAIPALVAIGQAHFYHHPPARFPLGWLRSAAVERTLAVLQRMQPHSGGYLEATPLTSFVVMSLASTGRQGHPVAQRGLQFLRESVRADGSWPIDTNLATWGTSLALNALGHCPPHRSEPGIFTADLLDWLLRCQHTVRHPFTGAAPGGWGWTNLSGAVPDADDTAGALLALSRWPADHCTASSGNSQVSHAPAADRIRQAATAGVRWLLDLQNRDGGWPTFCRGWGKLPFDRSGSDLTAHALRALRAWQPTLQAASEPQPYSTRRLHLALRRGLRALERTQQPDGSWLPLWFGNQHHANEENPSYGTTRVLLALSSLDQLETPMARAGYAWLLDAQHADGSWSGGIAADRQEPSSVEETAVAVEALAVGPADSLVESACRRGMEWLVTAVEEDCYRNPAPIGFYFAKLWYYEQLYPLVFTVAALGRAVHRFAAEATA
jgi:squalene-hopene/tetraprenyl-beta-curcumene cyclase